MRFQRKIDNRLLDTTSNLGQKSNSSETASTRRESRTGRPRAVPIARYCGSNKMIKIKIIKKNFNKKNEIKKKIIKKLPEETLRINATDGHDAVRRVMHRALTVHPCVRAGEFAGAFYHRDTRRTMHARPLITHSVLLPALPPPPRPRSPPPLTLCRPLIERLRSPRLPPRAQNAIQRESFPPRALSHRPHEIYKYVMSFLFFVFFVPPRPPSILDQSMPRTNLLAASTARPARQ